MYLLPGKGSFKSYNISCNRLFFLEWMFYALFYSRERRKSDADAVSDMTPDSSEMTLSSSRGYSLKS